MTRTVLRLAAMTVVLTAWSVQPSFGNGPGGQWSAPRFNSGPYRPAAGGVPAQAASYPQQTPPMPIGVPSQDTAYQPSGSRMIISGQRPGTQRRVVPAYPYLNAPLYTAPQQNIPYQMGGTLYTNQAFFPHEMLHEHEYKALYPPFYHRVKGHWSLMPWGMWSTEDWELQGTKVEVKYKSMKPFYSLFATPWLH